MELRRERNGYRSFVKIFDGQSGACSPDEATRFSNINCCADLGADNRELVIIVTVDFAGERQFVFKHHQCFVRDFADSQQIIGHDIFS